MKIKVDQIKSNPYRDLDKYPIDRAKVDALKESIQQTDFWDNLLCRPAGNTIPPELLGEGTVISYLADLDVAFNEDGYIFLVELAYGHHRLVAIQELGIEEIEIPCKSIDDKTMLKIMANENKDDWQSNLGVMLETVRQAREFLMGTVTPYETFDAYKEAGETFFSKEQFAQIEAQGIGYKPIQKFLGETWSAQDVRKAVAVIKDIDAELYEQEQIIRFPSVSVLGNFSKLAAAIVKQPWPVFFKDKMIEEITGMISDPKVSSTVKIITSATDAAKNGKDPVRVIRNPGLKRVDFNVAKAVKALCYENMDNGTKLELSELASVPGFENYPDIDKLIEEVQKSINRSEAAKAAATTAAETGEVQTMPDGTEITPEMAGDDEALEAMLDAAEAEVAVAEAPAGLPDVPEEDAEAPMDLDVFVQSASTMSHQVTRAAMSLADASPDDQGSSFTAVEDLTKSVVRAYMQLFGTDDVAKLINDIAAELDA